MRELYDAHPCGERALFLKTSTEQRVKESLEYLFNAVQDVIPDLNNKIQSNLETIKKTNLISGFYYLINSYLLKYAESKKLIQIYNLAQAFINLDYSHNSLDILKYKNRNIPDLLWELFDEVSLYDLPSGSSNYLLEDDDYQHAKEKILKAIRILELTCKDLWDEFVILVREIVILDSNRVIAGSSFDLLGLIYIKANPDWDIVDFLDFLIHEAAHQYIFNISSIDPLCLNDPTERYNSPLRKDPRPLVGIYHATFVTARLIYLFQIVEAYGRDADNIGLSNERINEKVTYYKKKYQDGVKTILKYGQLTPLGQKLIASTENIIT